MSAKARADVSPRAGASPKLLRRVRGSLLLALAALLGCLALTGSPWALPTGPGFAATDERPFRHTVQIALFWAALLDVGLLTALLASARIWTRPLCASSTAAGGQEPRSAEPGEAARYPQRVPALTGATLAVLLAAVVIGGMLRWPVAHKSFWWDEGWSITRVVRGYQVPSADDPRVLELEGRSWARTAWYWKKPTNHALYSLAGRSTLSAWRVVTGRGPEALDEFAFRLPAYVAALLTVLGVGLLGWRAGHPQAGAAAALLIALHPWEARYSVDARAYAFVIPFTLAAVLALGEALRRGHWPAWLGFAAAQLGLLWTHPFMIYVCVPLSAVALVDIARRGGPGVGAPADPADRARDRMTLLLRFTVSNVLAAAAFLFVMAPNLAQVFIWDDESYGRPLNAMVLKELWSRLATGLPYLPVPPGTTLTQAPALRPLFSEIPGLDLWVFAALPALAALGAARLIRERTPFAAPLLTLIATVPLSMAIVHLTGQLYYSRFYAYGSWPLALCLTLCVEAMARRLAPGRAPVQLLALAGFVAAFVALAAPQIARLWSQPLAPLRDVGEYTRARAGDDPVSVIRVGYGQGGGMPQIYDPWIVAVATAEEIDQQIARAESLGKPLYVYYGQERFNRRRRPQGFERLDDPLRFRQVAAFDAIEPRFTYRIFCYRGGPTPCPPAFPAPAGAAPAARP